jgi:shikimate kinase / 3-dehydroquinate synthase
VGGEPRTDAIDERSVGGARRDRVGIASVTERELPTIAVEIDRDVTREPHRSHVDRHEISVDGAALRAGVRIEHELPRAPLLCDVERDAAKTVPAHLGNGPVRIDDDHPRGGIRRARRQDEEHAIGAHAEATIADRSCVRDGDRVFVIGFDDHEIVPEPFVFEEAEPLSGHRHDERITPIDGATAIRQSVGMRSVVLSGFMATGKSTVGRIVAAELGLPFVDTDALVLAHAKADGSGAGSVGELFAREGEPRFRDREREVILPLLTEEAPRVIAFGGGSVTSSRIRHLALENATVVTLTATPEAIAERVRSISDRPNLGGSSPIDRARDLLALRTEAYAECHATVATDGKTPEEVARRIVQHAREDAIAVPLGSRSYCVELCDGDPTVLTRTIERLAPSRVITITDENVDTARGDWITKALGPTKDLRIVLSPGEPTKTLATVSTIWDTALAAGIDRNALVLAFGGGVVGDLAGFAASTLLRGIRCVQIATTLLAMVDSSVGGKTGFDHRVGKNLLGAFFQPSRVVIDIEHLTTLPERDRAAGLAEVVKIALVRDEPLHAFLVDRAEAIARGDRSVLREMVRRAVTAKMRVVREDETETGVRALLNLGHTVGHALEAHGGYSKWLHGEAVAIGTVLELQATERLGLTPAGTSAHARELLSRFGLPVDASRDAVVQAWPFVASDKKRAGDGVKLPIVEGIGRARVEKIGLADLGRALAVTS